MAYHVYTTPGIVLKSAPFGEAHKYFYILTRDLGLVIASAQSVRKETSKLSAGLEDFSYSHFSFVKGKHSWKLTSASSIENFYRLSKSKDEKFVIARLFKLLCQLVNGEEHNVRLFETVESFLFFLHNRSGLDQSFLHTIETWVVLKVLHILGFVSPRREYEELLFRDFSMEALPLLPPVHSMMVHDINIALRASEV